MYVSSACTKHRFAESQSVSQWDKVQARTESCLCGYWYTKQLYLPFTGFITYVVICLNIYMVSFTWNIIYPQSCLSYLLKQPYEFKKFYYYHFTHGKQRCGVLPHTISSKCQRSVQANMYDYNHTARCENKRW